MAETLIIFIKNPVLGRVKTRLARTLGDVEALRIYRVLLDKTRRAARAANVLRCLFYDDYIETDDEWPEADFFKYRQASGDLGERMAQAFRQVLDEHGGPALIVGSDCPELSASLIEQAFSALYTTDFVLGPTPDGGYYLLGMSRFYPEVFEGIAWSTSAVFEQTTQIIRSLGKSVTLLPVLSDIDVEEDWLAYCEKGTASPGGF